MAHTIPVMPNMEVPKIWGGTLKLNRREEAINREAIIMDTDNL
jgi:hypothetical protein